MVAAGDVTPVFEARLGRLRGPGSDHAEGCRGPGYGVSAYIDGGTIDLILTFTAGSAYCRYEPGCHTRLLDGERWSSLRQELLACGLVLPHRLMLRVAVVVEAGALFFDLARPNAAWRGRYALSASGPHRFDELVGEIGDV